MAALESQVIGTIQLAGVDGYTFSGDSVTVANKCRIVEGYRLKASIYHAAQYAGVARFTVYRYLDNDPEFAAAMADSFDDAGDVMESSVYERAMKSDLLAMFWLKAHRPKYRDRLQLDVEQLREQVREKIQGSMRLLDQSALEQKGED